MLICHCRNLSSHDLFQIIQICWSNLTSLLADDASTATIAAAASVVVQSSPSSLSSTGSSTAAMSLLDLQSNIKGSVIMPDEGASAVKDGYRLLQVPSTSKPIKYNVLLH